MASQSFHEESNTFLEFTSNNYRMIGNALEDTDTSIWHTQHTEKANHDEEIEHAWENADKLLDYYLH